MLKEVSKVNFLECSHLLTKTQTKEEDGSRTYYFNQKNKVIELPSVTTIISKSASQEEAISLSTAQKKWDEAYKKGKKKYSWEENRQNALNRGTAIHEYVESVLRKEVKITHNLPEGFEKIVAEIEKKASISTLIASEFFIANLDSISPYAGRADLYATIYGQKYLIDIKTSGKEQSIYQWGFSTNNKTGEKKRVKKYAAWYEKAIVQLTAYELAMNSWGEFPEALGIWAIHPKGLDQYTIDISKEERIKMWNQRLEVFLKRSQSGK